MTTKFLKLLGISLAVISHTACQQKEHEIVNRKSDSLDTFRFQLPDADHVKKENTSRRDASSQEHSKNVEKDSTSEKKDESAPSTIESSTK